MKSCVMFVRSKMSACLNDTEIKIGNGKLWCFVLYFQLFNEEMQMLFYINYIHVYYFKNHYEQRKPDKEK